MNSRRVPLSRPLVVAMHLERGEVRSQVEHLRADQDRFEVKTPNLVAQVRGTVFRVDVRTEGTRVATDKGVVRVNWGGQAVDVEAGRELQVLLGASVPEVHVRPQSPALSYGDPNAAADVDAEGRRLYFTTSASAGWQIQTLPGVKVLLYVNDELAGSFVGDEDGIVEAAVDLPLEGAYRVAAVMETLNGERSLPSPMEVLVVDRTPPSLLLTSPAEPQVQGDSVQVAGRTEPGVRVELNGEVIAVGETGEFNYKLSLVPGVNEFILVAADRAGNSVKTQSALIAESKAP